MAAELNLIVTAGETRYHMTIFTNGTTIVQREEFWKRGGPADLACETHEAIRRLLKHHGQFTVTAEEASGGD